MNNIKNIIETQEIQIFIKNEFAQGAIGDFSALDTWPELWVFDNADLDRAVAIVKSSYSSKQAVDWICKNYDETNTPSFKICWNCQSENA